MGWFGRSRYERARERESLSFERRPGEGYPPPPYTDTLPGSRERTRSHRTFLVLGLAAPFLLAVPLYTLAWYPVWYVVLPVAGFFRALLRPAQPAPPPPPGGPVVWDLGPLLSPQVALTWAMAFVAAWFVLSRFAGGRRVYAEDSPARRGFRAGLRLTLLVALLVAILWANRMLAGA